MHILLILPCTCYYHAHIIITLHVITMHMLLILPCTCYYPAHYPEYITITLHIITLNILLLPCTCNHHEHVTDNTLHLLLPCTLLP